MKYKLGIGIGFCFNWYGFAFFLSEFAFSCFVKYELVSIKLVTLWVLICWHDSSYKEQLREMRELGNKKKRSNLVGISFSLVSLTSGNFELVRLYPYVIFTPRILIWCWFHRLCFFFFLVCALTGYLHAYPQAYRFRLWLADVYFNFWYLFEWASWRNEWTQHLIWNFLEKEFPFCCWIVLAIGITIALKLHLLHDWLPCLITDLHFWHWKTFVNWFRGQD